MTRADVIRSDGGMIMSEISVEPLLPRTDPSAITPDPSRYRGYLEPFVADIVRDYQGGLLAPVIAERIGPLKRPWGEVVQTSANMVNYVLERIGYKTVPAAGRWRLDAAPRCDDAPPVAPRERLETYREYLESVRARREAALLTQPRALLTQPHVATAAILIAQPRAAVVVAPVAPPPKQYRGYLQPFVTDIVADYQAGLTPTTIAERIGPVSGPSGEVAPPSVAAVRHVLVHLGYYKPASRRWTSQPPPHAIAEMAPVAPEPETLVCPIDIGDVDKLDPTRTLTAFIIEAINEIAPGQGEQVYWRALGRSILSQKQRPPQRSKRSWRRIRL
jgi:hypothetical protein